jgi:hypothetical protein
MTAATIQADTTGTTDTTSAAAGLATGSRANAAIWTGRVISGFATLFLVFDGVIHVMKPQPVVDAFAELGYPLSVSVILGNIELVCLALYLMRPTAVLGAILLTGYLGGAIAAQVRIGTPLFSHVLFPIYVALLFWGGLYLRDPRVRAIIRLR